jgi:orotidine-5'-phosphate decarboxylase
MLRAACEAAAEAAAGTGLPRPALVGVTVLTSFSEADLKEVGVAARVEDQVARLVDLAIAAGLDGIVASPHEAAAVRRRAAGAPLAIVTPGIRPAAWPADDQARAASAGDAIAAGSDLLVVGRPVLRAPDPAAAARELVAEIERARAARPA